MTIDLEEWYHPEYVRDKASSRPEDYSSQALSKTFEILEKHSAVATFFVVGEIAQKHPEYIRQIEKHGHEVAFHGYNHESLHKKTADMLRLEINEFRNVIGTTTCIGFRAPSFSLNNDTKWALDVLEETRFKYDSSIFPASTPLYGMGHAPTKPYKPNHDDIRIEDEKAVVWEFPLHVHSSPILRLPMAGGFYLRFFPLRLIKRSIKKANKEGRPAVFFVHTWELNPEMPKLKLGFYKSFVTYHNVEKTASKLEQLLSQFEFTSVRNYMKEKGLM